MVGFFGTLSRDTRFGTLLDPPPRHGQHLLRKEPLGWLEVPAGVATAGGAAGGWAAAAESSAAGAGAGAGAGASTSTSFIFTGWSAFLKPHLH